MDIAYVPGGLCLVAEFRDYHPRKEIIFLNYKSYDASCVHCKEYRYINFSIRLCTKGRYQVELSWYL